MQWKQVQKMKAPRRGGYRDWKEMLAKEGYHQCVYCAISESQLGGARMFHVEHYRPKSKFPKKEDEYENLYYACAICNVYKSDDWPAEPRSKYTFIFYPDPSAVSYADVFRRTGSNGAMVIGRNVTGRYLVARLHLNRPHLVLERRMIDLVRRYRLFRAWVDSIIDNDGLSKQDLRALNKLLTRLADGQESYHSARPYSPVDMH